MQLDGRLANCGLAVGRNICNSDVGPMGGRAAIPKILTDDVIRRASPDTQGYYLTRFVFNFDLRAHHSALLEPRRDAAQNLIMNKSSMLN
jgi:hypothetical protein